VKGSTWSAVRREEQARRGKSVLVAAVDSRELQARRRALCDAGALTPWHDAPPRQRTCDGRQPPLLTPLHLHLHLALRASICQDSADAFTCKVSGLTDGTELNSHLSWPTRPL
jgi:hypothetical protein